MTSLNLATIFGPNLLHKQKNSDKEFVVQSFARAEESTAIISVVRRMIETYDTLFTVNRPRCEPGGSRTFKDVSRFNGIIEFVFHVTK